MEGYFALFGENRRPGGAEHPVGARGFEPGDLARRRETVAAVGERERHTAVGQRFHLLEPGIFALDALHTVSVFQRQHRQPFAHLPFARGVDVPRFIGHHEVGSRGHAAVGDHVEGLLLGFAQSIPPASGAVFVGRDLHEIEGQFTQSPQLAPMFHHGGLITRIILITGDVGAALIPQESADGVVAQGVEHAVVHHRRTAVAALLIGGFCSDIFVSERAEQFPGHPARYVRAAPATGDHPDGNAEYLVHRNGEAVGRGREARGIGRGGFHPAAVDDLPGLGRGTLADEGHADVFVLPAAEDHVGTALDGLADIAPEGHEHVGLPRTEPYLADQNVLHHDGLFAVLADRDRLRRIIRGRGGNLHRPVPVAVGPGRIAGLVPRHGDGDPAVMPGPAPQRGIAPLLQNHVSAHDVGKPYFGPERSERRRAKHGQKQQFFHSGHCFMQRTGKASWVCCLEALPSVVRP